MIDKLSILLGLSQQHVKIYILVFLVVIGIMLYLAVESGMSFYQRYQRSWEASSETQISPSESEQLLENANAPKWVSRDNLLPGGVLNETGQLVYCNEALAGENGLKYGWIWEADTHGCRKFRQINFE